MTMSLMDHINACVAESAGASGQGALASFKAALSDPVFKADAEAVFAALNEPGYKAVMQRDYITRAKFNVLKGALSDE